MCDESINKKKSFQHDSGHILSVKAARSLSNMEASSLDDMDGKIGLLTVCLVVKAIN